MRNGLAKGIIAAAASGAVGVAGGVLLYAAVFNPKYFAVVADAVTMRYENLKAELPQAIYQAIPGPAYKR